MSAAARPNPNAFRLEELNRKHFKNSVTSTNYRLHLDEPLIRDKLILKILEDLKDLFGNVLSQISKNYPTTAKISMGIDAEEINSAIVVPVEKITAMTPEKIISVIQLCVTSAFPGLRPSHLTRLDINVYVPPSGQGRHGICRIDRSGRDSRRDKRSIIQIKNKDTLCLARAIYVARDHFF